MQHPCSHYGRFSLPATHGDSLAECDSVSSSILRHANMKNQESLTSIQQWRLKPRAHVSRHPQTIRKRSLCLTSAVKDAFLWTSSATCFAPVARTLPSRRFMTWSRVLVANVCRLDSRPRPCADHRGVVDFESFQKVLNRPGGFRDPGEPEEYCRGFQVFDKDMTGYIGVGQLRYSKEDVARFQTRC